jgi:polysaccharide pyruvyl transferase WcaK-like protein
MMLLKAAGGAAAGVRRTPVSDAVKPRADGHSRVIGLAAHVGMGNIGDDLLFASALEYYRRRLPGARFVAFTMDANETKKRHGVDEVHPIRPPRRAIPTAGGRSRLSAYLRDLLALIPAAARELDFSVRSARRLRGLDLLIVTGSSQFTDGYGGPWGFPLTLLRWTILARLMRVPICFLSLGAEDIAHPLSRWMIRRTVHLANFVTLRDVVSRKRLAAYGVRRHLSVMPDLALAYPVPEDGEPGPQSGTLGINVVPYFHEIYWRASDKVRYRRYLEAMIDLTVDALQRGHRVVLYAMVEWADRVPAQDIVDAIRTRCGADAAARITTPAVHTFGDLWSVLSCVDWVVASRYHGVATAMLMRKPVIGLAYEEKTAELMKGFGVGEYAIALEDADGRKLSVLLDRLEANDATIRSTLHAVALPIRAALVTQYEHVLTDFARRRAGR